MHRWQGILATLALCGWLCSLVSHLIALSADGESRCEWIVRRNRFLLLSSLSTNTLVFGTLLRYVRSRRRGLAA